MDNMNIVWDMVRTLAATAPGKIMGQEAPPE